MRFVGRVVLGAVIIACAAIAWVLCDIAVRSDRWRSAHLNRRHTSVNWTKTHSAIIVAFLSGLAAMIIALPDWHTALQPPFIGGVVAMTAALLKATATESVRPREIWPDHQRAEYRSKQVNADDMFV